MAVGSQEQAVAGPQLGEGCCILPVLKIIFVSLLRQLAIGLLNQVVIGGSSTILALMMDLAILKLTELLWLASSLAASFATLSASSFPGTLQWLGTHCRVTWQLALFSLFRISEVLLLLRRGV